MNRWNKKLNTAISTIFGELVIQIKEKTEINHKFNLNFITIYYCLSCIRNNKKIVKYIIINGIQHYILIINSIINSVIIYFFIIFIIITN